VSDISYLFSARTLTKTEYGHLASIKNFDELWRNVEDLMIIYGEVLKTK